MDDDQFKQQLKQLFYKDLARRVAIEKLINDVQEKDLTGTIQRKFAYEADGRYGNFFCAKSLPGPEEDEADRLQRLRPHLEELYKKIAYDNLQRSAAEHQGPSEDAIEDMVRRHREEIGERFHEALQSRDRVDEKWEPEPGNKVFLAAPKPVTTISAINDWSAAPNPPCSLRSLSQKVIMDGLRQSLVGAKAKAAFCCGGSVAFRKTGLDGWEGLQPAVAPVTIHWDSKQSGARKIVFSHESSRDPQFAEDLEQLCRASEPASFGRGGETVRDDSYRLATKLDAADFATNFHPYDCGILSELENILLPSYLGDEYTAHSHRIVAELYKLNLYSGPRGLFKSHVDTPRSETQFGSLVICLPAAHEGGALVLRHNGRSIEFDWSGPAPESIQWAAFYSDCEHEVMHLTFGHRVTLTYNLYYRLRQPQPGQGLPLPVHSFPIYHDLKAALQTSGFMGRGGTLGFYCSHAYPHSNAKLRRQLPMALKGVDLLVFTVCRSLGLETKARPILVPDRWEDYEYLPRGRWEGGGWRKGSPMDTYLKARKRLRDFQSSGFHIPPYGERDDSQDNILPEYRNTTNDPSKHPLAEHELTLKYRRQGHDLEVQQDAYAPEEPSAKLEYLKSHVEVEGLVPPAKGPGAWVGSKLHEIKTPKHLLEDDSEFKHIWPNDRISGIHWLTERKHQELAVAFTAYGNETTTEFRYSAAAILVVVPPWTPERGHNEDAMATFSDEGANDGDEQSQRSDC